MNKEKWAYARDQVQFAGFTLSVHGYQVDDSITEAISKFPTPSCRSEIRSFVGLVNQLSACTPAVAGLLAPLRPLLSTRNDFLWTPEAGRAFATVKQFLTSAPVLLLQPTPAHSPMYRRQPHRLGLCTTATFR